LSGVDREENNRPAIYCVSPGIAIPFTVTS
jgi:hypothetical protein